MKCSRCDMQARCRYSDKLLCSYHYQKAYYSDPKFPERRRRISELNKSEQKRVRTDVMSILGGVKCKACECDDYTSYKSTTLTEMGGQTVIDLDLKVLLCGGTIENTMKKRNRSFKYYVDLVIM